MQDSQIDHVHQRFRNRRSRDPDFFGCGGNRDNGIPLHVLEHSKNRRGWPAQGFDLLLILFEKGKNAASCACSLIGGISDSNQKEVKPGLPISPSANAVKEIVIGSAIAFEKKTQIENWFPERTVSTQEKRN